MPERPPYYLTTPIYYVNARPHLGTAYSTIVTDTIARYKRAQGFDVFFLTGTDEHGQKIQRSAKAMNCTPQEFVDKMAAEFRALWDKLGLSYTDFIRTTEPRHKKSVQRLFTLLQERGYIYKGFYTGQYCVTDEAWVDVGPGEPCPDCGRITETVTEENYFFRLSAYQDRLIELYEQAGFHAYHLAEHHATPLGMAPSPSVFLAAVAQRTKTLRFGPLVYTVNLYHPLRLIDEICMLDQLSGGRLELGIGRGISPYEVGYYGVDPATGPERFAEALDVILKGLTEKRLSHHGKYFTFEDVPMEMQPVQRPHPPLWYGVSIPDSKLKGVTLESYRVT